MTVLVVGAGVVIQLIKKKHENEIVKVHKLRLVDDDVLYNWPIFGHSFSLDADQIEFGKQIGRVVDSFNERYPNDLYAVLC